MNALLCLALAGLAAEPPPFRAHPIAAFEAGYQVAAADVSGDGRPDVIALSTAKDTVDWFENPTWQRRPVARTPKNVDLAPRDIDGECVMRFDFEGPAASGAWRRTRISPGAPPESRQPGAPRGSSEIVPVRLGGDRLCLAAIEPWHGNQLVLYQAETAAGPYRRQVLDQTLREGHALAAADFDDDGLDEIVAGWRGAGGGLLLLDPTDASGHTFRKVLIEDKVPVEGLALADFNGDRRLDFVAAAGRTNRLVWYENRISTFDTNPNGSEAAMDKPRIEKDGFGTTADGREVDRYTLRNQRGMMVRMITYGAIVTELRAPDRNGKADDVVLGFDNLAQYETESPYFGCLIGRVAFRTAKGLVELDGRTCQLTTNNNIHHMHGGTRGLSHVVWQAEPREGSEPAVLFSYTSPDGDQGYPGTLRVTALHTLTAQNELRIDLAAATDKPCPVNMTHHGYFNLSGAGNGNVLDHVVWIDADRYSVMSPETLPTGELAPVEGSRLDFRKPTPIRARPHESGSQGYDLGYLHNRPGGWLSTVARVRDPASGRTLEVATTEPALIFYTGNALKTLRGKNAALYGQHSGLCLEPGRLPDSVHHANFPPIVLRPGEQYRHTFVYRLGVDR